KSSTQDFMAAHDLVQALLQRLNVQCARQPRRTRNQVKTAVGLQVFEEPQPLLSKRQGRVFIVLLRCDRRRLEAMLSLDGRVDGLSQRGNRRTGKELAQRQLDVKNFQQS